MAMRPLAWTLASLTVVAAAAACGGSEEALPDREIESVAVSSPADPSQADASSKPAARPEAMSRREKRATRIVKGQVSGKVTCRDNGAVNTKLRPEYPVTYICSSKHRDSYVAVVSADGALMSLRGPVHLDSPVLVIP
jgi:hypothetical protein